METMKLNFDSRAQLDGGANRRHIVFDQESNFRADQLKPGIKQHAVSVILGLLHREAMNGGKAAKLVLPPFIRLDDKNDIRISLSDYLPEKNRVSIVHFHVRKQQADSRFVVGLLRSLYLFTRKDCVWPNLIGLIKDA